MTCAYTHYSTQAHAHTCVQEAAAALHDHASQLQAQQRRQRRTPLPPTAAQCGASDVQSSASTPRSQATKAVPAQHPSVQGAGATGEAAERPGEAVPQPGQAAQGLEGAAQPQDLVGALLAQVCALRHTGTALLHPRHMVLSRLHQLMVVLCTALLAAWSASPPRKAPAPVATSTPALANTALSPLACGVSPHAVALPPRAWLVADLFAGPWAASQQGPGEALAGQATLPDREQAGLVSGPISALPPTAPTSTQAPAPVTAPGTAQAFTSAPIPASSKLADFTAPASAPAPTSGPSAPTESAATGPALDGVDVALLLLRVCLELRATQALYAGPAHYDVARTAADTQVSGTGLRDLGTPLSRGHYQACGMELCNCILGLPVSSIHS